MWRSRPAAGLCQLPSLKAAVLMYKAAAEGGGKLGVKRRRGRGVSHRPG
ncbi:hypothetical protein ODS41_10570 [Pyrobaculum sp. 3827-6]|nr:hypothetical protein [Pyrobaculum sp. 3827-6]